MAALSTTASAEAQDGGAKKPSIYELRVVHLRNSPDNQRQRMLDLMEHGTLPTLKKYGVKSAGFFASSIAPGGPYVVALVEYPSLAAFEEIRAKVNADEAYAKQIAAFNAQPGLSYQRIDSSLLRAFPGMPGIEVPTPQDAKRPGRVFELRTYESNNSSTLRKKIEMFEKGGEAAIFRKLGMQPVFFAETIVGANMPNLTYMLAYDDLAARERMWKAFGSDPEWQKLRATPGLSDAEIVSNISTTILSPLAFSPIR